MPKEYLGDSVYVQEAKQIGGIILTTENGIPTDPSNKIFLEPEVIQSLLGYIKRLYPLMK